MGLIRVVGTLLSLWICGAQVAHAVEKTIVETTYTCPVCSHVYDGAADCDGMAFEDCPDTFVCPVCGQPKSAFVPSSLMKRL